MTTEAPILICYDGTDLAGHAIEVAAQLLGGRNAVVLDVGPPLTAEQSIAASASPLVMPEFQDENLDTARRRARAGAELARAAGFHAEFDAELDAPTWEGIVDQAKAIDAAVIVVGSHGRGAVSEFFEGSVSHQVATHADRPVLIVPGTPGQTS